MEVSQKMGVPPNQSKSAISNNGMFPTKNHPAIGVPILLAAANLHKGLDARKKSCKVMQQCYAPWVVPIPQLEMACHPIKYRYINCKPWLLDL